MPRSRSILGLTLLLVSCGGKAGSTPATPPAAKTTASAKRAPATLPMPKEFRHIPASTPYLFALNLDTPWVRSRVAFLGMAAEEVYRELKTLRPSMTGEDAALADAVLDLVGDELSIRSLERLGIPAFPKFYIYGIGLMPALRLQLTSGKKLHVAVQKLREFVGKDFPAVQTIGGHEYWYISDLNDDKPDLSLAIAIVGDELVAGLIVDELKDEMLRVLLGATPPASSLATSSSVRSMVTRYGIEPDQLVFFDVVEIAAQLLGATRGLPGQIAAHFIPKKAPTTSPVCQREIRALAAIMPRIVGGSKLATKNRATGTFVMELHPDVVYALRSSRAAIPGGDLSRHQGPLAVGLGLDVEQLSVQVVSAARRVQQKPFACPELRELNRSANMLGNAKVEPVLSQIGSPTGLAAVLTRLDLKKMDVAGALAISGRDVDAMWTLAKTFVPSLASVSIGRDGSTVRLPAGALGTGMPAFAARNELLLGVSVGADSDSTLAKLMSGAMGGDDLIATMYYDATMSEANDLAKLVAAMRENGLAGAADRLTKRLAERTTQSRGVVTVRVAKTGLVVDWELREE